MMKYIILELGSIASFVVIVIFFRQLESSTQIQTVFTALFIGLLLLILLIIPSMILLSTRDKISPNAPLNKNTKSMRLKNHVIAKSGGIIVLSWLFYFLSTLNNNTYLRYLSYIIPLIGFVVLYKVWKRPHNWKAYLIFIGLISVTFIIILFLFQALLLIPFYL